MKTSCAIRVHEIDGKECGVGKEEIIINYTGITNENLLLLK